MSADPSRTRKDAGTLNAGAPAAVLVVNDYAAQRLAVRAILAPIGLAVVEADSGRAALRAVLRQTFAAILMDVRMPTLDGYETAKLIRERRERELTPIIFMTAYGRDETDTFAGYAQGAVDFIFTPVDPDLLRARISALVELYLQTQGLRDLADSEPLTGLLNRRRFDEELTTQVTRSSRYDERAALLMIDLDGFKAVNDTHGHPAGDLLLKAIADGLRQRLRAGDVLARVGGDEFAVLATHIDAEEAELVANHFRFAVAASGITTSSGQAVNLTASIGVGLINQSIKTSDEVWAAADRAMYQQKLEAESGAHRRTA